MKKIITYCIYLLTYVVIFGSCAPENYTLGDVDVTSAELAEGTAYKIEHDASNPNIVYLTSLMGTQYTPLWEHPQGHSQASKVTLKIPFAGEYTVKFGVETRGGIVYGDPVTFKVDQLYPGFISDEMWTLLTGGPDQEKTWYLDLDAAGLSRYYLGPVYYYGTGDWYGNLNGSAEPLNSDSWNWQPDWKGNTWLMDAGDYGQMTFDLKGSANVNVDHKMFGKVQKGSFTMDTENKSLKFSNATILHGAPQEKIVADWNNVRIMSLTKNTMQLAVFRDKALSGEDPCLLVFNYISKEYKDDWEATP